MKNSGILQRGRSQIPKQHFSSFYGTLRLSCAQPTGNSFTRPKPMVPMESRDCEGVPFAGLENLWPSIWQILGPRKVPKSGHVTIWKNWKFAYKTHVEKFTDSKNDILFDLRWKTTKLSRKTVSKQRRHQALLWTLGRFELTLVINTSFYIKVNYV